MFLAFDPELWDPSRRRAAHRAARPRPNQARARAAPRSRLPARRRRRLELVVDGGFVTRWKSRRSRRVRAALRRRPRCQVPRRAVGLAIDAPRAGYGRSARRALRTSARRRPRRAVLGCRRRAGGPRHGAAATARRNGLVVRPATRGTPKRLELVVDAVLEDVAGNSVARVFDRDLGDRDAPPRSRPPPVPVRPGIVTSCSEPSLRLSRIFGSRKRRRFVDALFSGRTARRDGRPMEGGDNESVCAPHLARGRVRQG